MLLAGFFSPLHFRLLPALPVNRAYSEYETASISFKPAGLRRVKWGMKIKAVGRKKKEPCPGLGFGINTTSRIAGILASTF
jgi:hypothetical protein